MRRFSLAVAVAAATVSLGLATPHLGVGTQFTLPAVYGISARYFWGEELGAEAIVFLFSFAGDTEGVVSGRVLLPLARAEGAGFYLAGGIAVPVGAGRNAPILCLVGGIELSLPFAPAIWLNTEFGFTSGEGLDLGMAFGVGIHYYFDLGDFVSTRNSEEPKP